MTKPFEILSERELRAKGPPKTFDNTMRTTFLQCQRKFYWWKVRGADYLIRPSYFSWGTAWHLIKGHWYKSKGIKAEPYSDLWKRDATFALLVGLNFWDNSGATDIKSDTRANLQSLWKAYLITHPNEPWTLIKGGAELGWRWPLPAKGGQASHYFLGGSMDGYIHWEGFGNLCLEEKTTGMWLSDFWILQWAFSSQITGYIWYLTQLLGTEGTYGALINMATKQIPNSGFVGKTSQFETKLETRTEASLKEFETDWRRDIESIEQSYKKWHFPKTTDTINCTGGIGKSACPYKGICLSGVPKGLVDPLSFPNLTYRREKWEPWKRTSGEIARGISKFLPTRLVPVDHKKGILNPQLEEQLIKTRILLWGKEKAR